MYFSCRRSRMTLCSSPAVRPAAGTAPRSGSVIAPLDGMRTFRFESSWTSNTETSMRSPVPSVRSATSGAAPRASASGGDTGAGADAPGAAVVAGAGDGSAAAGDRAGCDGTPAHELKPSNAAMMMLQRRIAFTLASASVASDAPGSGVTPTRGRRRRRRFRRAFLVIVFLVLLLLLVLLEGPPGR